ncbi:MAG: hypothetical protein V8R48_15370 [Eggerthella lenta]
MSEDRKNVYVTLHKDFVRTDIEYADRATGETRTFNSVTLPKGPSSTEPTWATTSSARFS